MTNQLQPEQIKQLLNRSLAQLEQPTLARLHDARTQALAHYDARRAASAFALAGLWTGSWYSGSHQKYHYWAAVILFAACLFSGAAYWQHANEHDIGDVDVAILTDELPIELYVD